eukprot:304544_1
MLSLVIIISLIISSTYGHHGCYTDEKARQDISNNPSLKYAKDYEDKKWQQIVKETGGHTKKWRIKNGYGLTGINDDNERRRLQLVNGNIDIPVIIHILYNSQSNNVNSYMRYINRLMINMNEGFNMLNNDVSTNWGNIPGDMDITFFINQIHHYNVGSNSPYEFYGAAIKNAKTGAAPIDPEHNLNIWFVQPNESNKRSSAYASFPWDNDIGIVINVNLINNQWTSENFGQMNEIFTHETGHWVGLYHIWGFSEETGDTPTCDADDTVTDTPNMASKWDNECPSYGVNTCSNGSPDMFENFMSYSNCVNMFTDGQVARARSNFGTNGNRKSFVTYKNNPKSFTFVNMIYFVKGTNAKCMKNDVQRNVNLNEGVGGRVIYLCISYTNNPYVDMLTGLELMSSKDSDIIHTPCPDNTYTKIDVDLNEDINDSLYILLCFKKESQSTLVKSVITDLQVFSFANEYTLQYYDKIWKIMPIDLNKDLSGNFLYIGY